MIEAYMCHHIRGPKGDDSTPEEREANRNDAIKVAKALESMMPNLSVYCPGGNDTWGEVAYSRGILTIDKILEIDCAIIDTMDCVLVYDKYPTRSGGMKVEIEYCAKMNKPYCSFTLVNWDTPRYLGVHLPMLAKKEPKCLK